MSYSPVKIIFLAILLSGNFLLSAQDYAEVKFDGKSITTDPLPYGQKIKIKGDAKGADSVVFILRDLDRPLDDDIKKQWTRSKEDETEFEINFDTPLRFKTNYDFKYYFFKKLSDEQVNTLLEELSKVAEGVFVANGRTTIPAQDVLAKLKETKSVIEDEVKVKEFSNDLAEVLSGNRTLLNAIQASESAKKNMETEKTAIGTQQIAGTKTIMDLISELVADKTITKDNYGSAHTELINSSDVQSLADGAKGTATSAINAKTRPIRDYLGFYFTKVDEDKVIEEQKGILGAELQDVAYNGFSEGLTDVTTDLQAVMVGTSFGLANVWLNAGSREASDVDLFSYFAFKFFFAPVDKGLKNAYVGNRFFDRWYFLVGVVTSENFKFKNQDLQNTNLGVKPVVGFGRDFNRFISIEGGMVFYDQPNVSPAIESARLKGSFFLGLSFDVDIINALSKRDKYYSK
ncbi:MAG: hypothetical protein R8G66_21070 [Cytophagales bacterium]|nr:hypothetical protein [Cytophagales bacterium]